MESEYETQLDKKIQNAAAYIERIGNKHPNYPSALKKYDSLCGELKEIYEIAAILKETS